MNIAAKNTASKLFVALVAVAMLFSVAAPAKAATVEELQAQIAALMAQISSLSGGSSAPAAGCMFTRALTTGSTGADVTCLQNYLIGGGFGISAGATGYFGSQTASAVASWQAANGVTPAAGYFGPVSQAKYNALMADGGTTPGGDDSDDESGSGSLGNDEGDIDSISEVSADESSLEEGQEGGVLAFELDIEGDVEVDRIDVFAAEDGSASDNADDYFMRAFLLLDGEEIAEVDVDDWDQDDYNNLGLDGDDYRIRFSGLGLVFEDGDEPEFQVGFEMLSKLDSTDLASDWDVELGDIRFVDGKGFTDNFDASAVADSFGFDAEETAELDISKSSDSPDSTTIEVDEEDESEEFELFVVDIQEENGVDITIDEITMTASTTEGDVTTTIDEVLLYVDGEEVGSDSPAANGALVFEDLGIELGGDDELMLSVVVIFSGTDDYTEGDSVFLTFNAVTEADDANGNDEGDVTGANPTDFSSDTFYLRSEGLVLEVGGITETEEPAAFSGDFDTGTYVFEIDVTAFGDDFYMDEDVANVDFDVLVDNVVVAAASSTASLDISGADTAANADYKISKNDSGVTLTLTVETADDVAGSVKVRVNSVAYSAADDSTEELTENATPATDWTSDSLILN